MSHPPEYDAERLILMKKAYGIPLRMAAAVLAVLIMLPVGLTACHSTSNPSTDTDALSSGETNPGETATDNTATPGGETSGGTSDTDTPPADTTVGGETTDPSGDVGGDPSDETSSGSSNQPATPGGLIGDGVQGNVYPTFSKVGGRYTGSSETVEITAPEGYTIRYTTDGSVPSRRDSKYKSAIKLPGTVGEGTVLRAACFDENNTLVGQVITHTYVCVESMESLTYTVMLSTDDDNLNDMYAQTSEKIERAAHAEIIAPDGTRVVSQDVGLRLFGGSSRGLAQKSFKIIARKDGYFGDEPYVGAGTFTYAFFPDRIVQAGKNAGEVLTKYDGLILRNGGNDSLLSTAEDGADACLLRDGIANQFVHRYATHVAGSLAHFAVVYLNGEYYGILELRENQNEDYVKRVWGVSDDDVVVVKSELDTSLHCYSDSCTGYGCRFCGVWFFYETDEDAAAQAELEAWIALCKKAAGAVNASEAEYQRVFEEVSAKLDLQNAMEYLAVACYLCNTDWPHNNVRVWRYTGVAMDGVEITDGKWRFATRDMDMSMARYSSPEVLPELDSRADVDMFSWVLSNYVRGYDDNQRYNDALYLQGLFAFLMRDDSFRTDFAAYCRTIASEEATQYLLELYEEAYGQVKPIIRDHIDRWGSRTDMEDARDWADAAGRVKSFIKARSEYFLTHLDTMLSMYD